MKRRKSYNKYANGIPKDAHSSKKSMCRKTKSYLTKAILFSMASTMNEDISSDCNNYENKKEIL